MLLHLKNDKNIPGVSRTGAGEKRFQDAVVGPEGNLAAFSSMDTMVVLHLNDIEEFDHYSKIERFLKSSSLQAYKSFGGKRWGFNISKDNFEINTGIDCNGSISC